MSDTLIGTFTVAPSMDRILLPNHRMVNGDQVRFALGAGGNTLPTPLVQGTYYFLVGVRGNDFMVAAIQNGAAIDITDNGTGSNQVWGRDSSNVYLYRTSSTVESMMTPAQFAAIKLISP